NPRLLAARRGGEDSQERRIARARRAVRPGPIRLQAQRRRALPARGERMNTPLARIVAARRLHQLLSLDIVGDQIDTLDDAEARRLLRQLATRLRLIADDGVEEMKVGGTIAPAVFVTPARQHG